MTEPVRAPIIVNALELSDVATEPTELYPSSAAITVFMQSSVDYGSLARVRFGADESMDAADNTNSFPVPHNGIRWTVAPSARYFSAVAANVDAALIWFVEGQASGGPFAFIFNESLFDRGHLG